LNVLVPVSNAGPSVRLPAHGLTEIRLVMPLLPFMAPLARARREGVRAYSALASRVAARFHARWVEQVSPAEVDFLTQPDASALADLSASSRP
jgi:hypothetical protein